MQLYPYICTGIREFECTPEAATESPGSAGRAVTHSETGRSSLHHTQVPGVGGLIPQLQAGRVSEHLLQCHRL